MAKVKLNGDKLRFADYDERAQRLVIEFADHSSRAFKNVPREVFMRLTQAPNAQAYFEDRIAQEYPNEAVAVQTQTDAVSKLNDLFK
jgi:ABC-type antimicrobial peptide transport system ATPase subunit